MINFDTTVGYTPGVIGRVTELHAKYYAEKWRFGSFFEGKVATELSRFIMHYNDAMDRIWSLSLDGNIEGSIAIDGTSESKNMAHLRWFIVSGQLRGKGAGNYLMEQAVSFCKEVKFEKVYLWTFQGLSSARHLYEKFGFELVQEQHGEKWGTPVNEQKFELEMVFSKKKYTNRISERIL